MRHVPSGMSLLMALSLLMAFSPLTAPSLLMALLTATLSSAAAPSPVPALCQGTGRDMAMLGCWGGPAAAATCRLWGEETSLKGDD